MTIKAPDVGATAEELRQHLASAHERIAKLNTIPKRKEPETVEELQEALRQALEQEDALERARLLQYAPAAKEAHAAFCTRSHMDQCSWAYESNDSAWFDKYSSHEKWLNLVAIAAAKARIGPEEAEKIATKFRSLDLTPTQVEFLRHAIATPCIECLNRINNERIAARRAANV